MLLPLIYLIRHGLTEKVDLSGDILIIDSFPVPVCQPIRNRRAKIFRGLPILAIRQPKKSIIMVLKFTLLLATTATC